jgi:type IX secretion system PorP/SprF family membrane protein
MRKGSLIVCMVLLLCLGVNAQSVHFSQYYNAPILVTPANTGLMPDNDFRLGLNYRNQWSALPVPYNTISAWGDLKIGGNKDNDHNNWLGLGFAFYSDKAGDGQLKLSQIQGNLAYHLQMSSTSMISLGLSAASVQRSVNYDLLTFDAQWDGFAFNSNYPNAEKVGILRTSFYTIGAGVNFAWFPSETVYLKLGGGAVNINKPIESFYAGGSNEVALRPAGTLDVVVQTGPILIVNPSVYYTQQNGATELVGGVQVRTYLSGSGGGFNTTPIQLLLGGYYRLTDAAIMTAGIQAGPVQFMASYDMTMSSLAPYNASYGALEFSLIYQGAYGRNKDHLKRSYTCPRFN